MSETVLKPSQKPKEIAPEIQAKLDKALSQAKIHLLKNANLIFFASLAFSLNHSFTYAISTAGTDGKNVKYNPDFFLALTKEERAFLLAHEAMHVAYLHLIRKTFRNHQVWNMATDYCINLQLVDRGMAMPAGGLLDQRYKDMSSEAIYEYLENNPSAQPSGGAAWDDLGELEGEPAQHQQEVEDMVIRASIQAKSHANYKPGNVPEDIEIFLDKLLNPKLPWHRILAKFVQSTAKNDYSYRKPNRRYMPKHYLPSLYSQAMGEIVIAVDTSGSVSDQDFAQFISETYSIFKIYRPKKITFIQFDTEIKRQNTVRNLGDLKNLKFSGRGGTDPTEVIQYIQKANPVISLIFTDGYFNTVKEKVASPLIWLIHDNKDFTAQQGKVIHYDL